MKSQHDQISFKQKIYLKFRRFFAIFLHFFAIELQIIYCFCIRRVARVIHDFPLFIPVFRYLCKKNAARHNIRAAFFLKVEPRKIAF